MAMKDTENKVSVSELIAAEAELADLKEQYGLQEQKKKGIFSRLMDFFCSRQEVTVNRKKYLMLNIFLGWAGGHRFYSKRYFLGILYLLFCWTGISVAMSIIYILVALPKPVDDTGNIQI